MAGASNVRVPANFVIAAGGRLRPSQISVPPGFAVALTMISGDGAAHHVVLSSPAPKSLSVPPHGRATVRVAGLKKGGYPVKVDGRTAGILVIGGQPGP